MKYVYFVLSIFFMPFLADAEILITEIMYDLDGSDAKAEWIEIYNSGNSAVDLTDWRFNDGSNHTFAAPPKNGGQGSVILEPQTFAVVASDATTFLSTHIVSVSVIDSVMSLNNTAETLQIRNPEGVVVTEVSYTSDLGGNGDGKSLQLFDGVWNAGIPTPGNGERPSAEEADAAPEEEPQQQASTIEESSGSLWPVEPQIFAFAGNEKREAVVGGTLHFTGDALGLEKQPLANARYMWSFGDGSIAEGQTVTHTYHHPGKYVVMLDVASGKYAATDRVYVTVSEADISLSIGDGYVAVANNGSRELDVSWWRLVVAGDVFTIPKHTYILANQTVSFANKVTGLSTELDSSVALQYPNGDSAEEFHGAVQLVAPVETTKVPVVPIIVAPSVTSVVDEESQAKQNTSEYVAVQDVLQKDGNRNVAHVSTKTDLAVENPTPIHEEKTVREALSIEVGTTSQLALAGIDSRSDIPLAYWLLGVLGIALLGVTASKYARPTELAVVTNSADEYTIIDESEIDSK